jgi:hypothetical protein
VSARNSRERSWLVLHELASRPEGCDSRSLQLALRTGPLRANQLMQDARRLKGYVAVRIAGLGGGRTRLFGSQQAADDWVHAARAELAARQQQRDALARQQIEARAARQALQHDNELIRAETLAWLKTMCREHVRAAIARAAAGA